MVSTVSTISMVSTRIIVSAVIRLARLTQLARIAQLANELASALWLGAQASAAAAACDRKPGHSQGDLVNVLALL